MQEIIKKKSKSFKVKLENRVHKITGWQFTKIRRILGLWNETLYFAIMGGVIWGFWVTRQISMSDIFIITGISIALFLQKTLLKKDI